MSGLELTASLLMPLNAWLVARRSMWNWPVGVVTVGLLMFVFAEAKLYAATGLQALFLALNLYGWWAWRRAKPADDAVPLVRVSPAGWAATIAICVAGAAAIATLLARTTDAAQPWWDSGNTALALAAQWWQARRAVECWPLWVAVNVGSTGLYAVQGLWPAAASYAVLLLVALWGWREWRMSWRAQAA